MLKFKQLQINNFLSISSISLNLENRGLIMLSGNNTDNPSLNNNGSGKSSIIEAIVFALYGKTLRGVRGDAVVNRLVGKDLEVSLEIVDENATYTIIRHRLHSTYKNKSFLYRDTTDITPKSEADLEIFINRLLQADFALFTASLLYSNDSFKLSTASDTEIKRTFDMILGLDILQMAYQETKDRLKDNIAKMSIIHSQLAEKQQQLKRLQSDISDIQEKAKGKRERERRHLVESIESLEEKGEKLSKDLDTLKVELDVAKKHSGDLEEVLTSLKENHKRNETIKEEILKVKESLLKEKSTISRYQMKVRSLTSDLKSYEKKLADLQLKTLQLQNKLKDMWSLVGTPCEQCGRPLTENEISVLIAFEEKKLPSEQEVASVVNEINLLKQELQDNSAKITQSQRLCEELTKRISKLAMKIDEDVEKKIATVESTLKQSTKEVFSLESEIRSVKSDLHTNITRIAELNKRLESLETDFSVSAVEVLQDTEMTLKAEIPRLRRELDLEKKLHLQLRFWEKAYSNRGIKSFILDDVTPILNKKLNYYLSKLTSGQIEAVFSTQTELKSGDKREKFNLEIRSLGGGQYQSNSSGEKKRIDLAVHLALQSILSLRSKKIDIAMFDEIFDSLDEKGIDGVVQLLQELAKEKSTIIVITHNEYLKSYFTKGITVLKKDGLSTLKEEYIQ